MLIVRIQIQAIKSKQHPYSQWGWATGGLGSIRLESGSGRFMIGLLTKWTGPDFLCK